MFSIKTLKTKTFPLLTSVFCACFLLPEAKPAMALTEEEKQQWRRNLELVGAWKGDMLQKRGGGPRGNLHSFAEIGPNYGKITISDEPFVNYAKFLCEYGFKLENGVPVDVLPISKSDPNSSPCPQIEEPFKIQRVTANTLDLKLDPEMGAFFPEVDLRNITMRSGKKLPPYPSATQNIDIPFPRSLDSFGVSLKTSLTEAIEILAEKGFEIDDRDLKSGNSGDEITISARSVKDGRTVVVELSARALSAPSVFVDQGGILSIATRVEYSDVAKQPVHINALLSAIKKKFPIVGTIVKVGERNDSRSLHLAWDLEGKRCDALGKSRLPKCERQKSTTYEMHASFNPSTSKVKLYTINIRHPFLYIDHAGHQGDGSYRVPNNAPLFHNFYDAEIQVLYEKSKEILGFTGETSAAPDL
jgi:hypothetical protein